MIGLFYFNYTPSTFLSTRILITYLQLSALNSSIISAYHLLKETDAQTLYPYIFNNKQILWSPDEYTWHVRTQQQKEHVKHTCKRFLTNRILQFNQKFFFFAKQLINIVYKTNKLSFKPPDLLNPSTSYKHLTKQ